MGVKFANSAYATLASSITSSATSITLTTGQGARFPSLGAGDYFYATLIDTSNNLEIVKCTARSTDVLTVVRGQESTTARAYSAGDRIELRITAQGIVDSAPVTSVAGRTGAVTLSSSDISGLAASATTDTTNASNISSGTLAVARMPSKTIIKAETYTSSVRQVTSASTDYEVFSWTFTKLRSDTSLLITGVIPTFGNTNDGDNWYVKIGSDYYYTGIIESEQGPGGKLVGIHTLISAGAYSASTLTVRIGWKPYNGAANRNVDVVNQNVNEDSRTQQTGTHITIFEVMP